MSRVAVAAVASCNVRKDVLGLSDEKLEQLKEKITVGFQATKSCRVVQNPADCGVAASLEASVLARVVAQETIESSIGMAMIYSVTEACQDRTKLSPAPGHTRKNPRIFQGSRDEKCASLCRGTEFKRGWQ